MAFGAVTWCFELPGASAQGTHEQMTYVMTAIPVCILAGGGSRRFGSPKGLAEIGGTSLIARVIDRVSRQTNAEIVINAAVDGAYGGLGLPIVPDALGRDLGPLAGVHAAMVWGAGQGSETVATVALDTPFLPADLLSRLENEGAPAIAASGGRNHPVIGLWPCSMAGELAAYIAQGRRSAHGWAEACGARAAMFESAMDGRDPFWNVNTINELEDARKAASGSAGADPKGG